MSFLNYVKNSNSILTGDLTDIPRRVGGADAVPAELSRSEVEDDRRPGGGAGGGAPVGVVEGRSREPSVHVGRHPDQVLLDLRRGPDELLHPGDDDGVEILVEDLDEVPAPGAARRQGLPVRLPGGEGLVAGAPVHEEVAAEFSCVCEQ